jgi:hypothetical protein
MTYSLYNNQNVTPHIDEPQGILLPSSITSAFRAYQSDQGAADFFARLSGGAAKASRIRASLKALQFVTPLSDEPRHQLDMRRVAKLVDRRDALDAIAAIDQEPGVADEGRHVAGHRDHGADLARGELNRLRLRALPRRIEHDRVEVAQFLQGYSTPKQLVLGWLC